jgi:hypothetical protein
VTRSILALGLIALATFTSHLWTPRLLERPAVMAFVLSDAFWPSVFGALLVASVICAAACAALVFHPDTLSGRTAPEGGE